MCIFCICVTKMSIYLLRPVKTNIYSVNKVPILNNRITNTFM